MKFNNQKEMFLWIWENRPHVSQLSGDPLVNIGHPQWHWQFLHILAKNFSKWKLKEHNVLLGTINEHTQQTSGWDDEELMKKWDLIYDKKLRLYYANPNK